MVTANQKSVIDMHTKKEKLIKHNAKYSHQIQENKTRKGGKTYKNKSKTNKQKNMAVRITLIITFKYKQIKYSNQVTD